VTVIANDDERVFCGGYDNQLGRSDPDKDLDEFEDEEDGKLHDYALEKVEEGFPIIVVPSGSAVVEFQSNWHFSRSGFEFEIAELTRLELIEIHVQVINAAFFHKQYFRNHPKIAKKSTKLTVITLNRK
jgi:hypothetical protein